MESWQRQRGEGGLKRISEEDIVKAIGALYLQACLNEKRHSVETEELMYILQPKGRELVKVR